MRHVRLADVREVRRRGELEDEPLAGRVGLPDLPEQGWPMSPPNTTGPSSVSTTTIWWPRVSPGAGMIPDAGKDLGLPVVLDVVRVGEVDRLADRVVVLRARVLELDPLQVDRRRRGVRLLAP